MSLGYILRRQREELVVGLRHRLAERVVVEITQLKVFKQPSGPALNDPRLVTHRSALSSGSGVAFAWFRTRSKCDARSSPE